MTTKLKPPARRKSSAEREEWLNAINGLFSQVKEWADAEGWATKEYEKTIREELLGEYVAPKLLVHAPEGRLMLDPIGRSVPGAIGLVDMYAVPSLDYMLLLRHDDGWMVKSNRTWSKPTAWNKRTFLRHARRLLKMAE